VTDLPLTLGTAGHIDHGKTALVRALTGKDTDRLPEEHKRGISIELGYAQLRLPSGRNLSVVDVPGHERFVRTMVAGATGIDFFLLCVAADDGVMPQTREHMAVLRQLGVDSGVVAVTKSDVADPAAAMDEAAELAPGAEAVAVSALRGDGLDDLLAALDRAAAATPSRGGTDGAQARLHVDRSFMLKGIGTVVTGTLWSGSLAAGDHVQILPAGKRVRIRSVQVHDQQVERAAAGQRVALNLAGVPRESVARGDVLVSGLDVEPAYIVDARLEFEPDAEALAPGARIHVHHGTRESPGRVYPLGDGYAQLRLENPIVAERGDRVILRRLAPPDTIGGGVIVEAPARRHSARAEVVDRLRAVEAGKAAPDAAPAPPPREIAEPAMAPALDAPALALAELLKADGERPRGDAELAAAAGADAAPAFAALERAGRAVRVAKSLHFAPAALDALVARVVAVCARDGSATIAGVRDELGTSRKYAQAILEHLDATKVTIRRGDEHYLRNSARSLRADRA
jgi:selenocysteine-specific elongation factor